MDWFGIKFVGLIPENGRKLLLTVALIIVVIILRWVLRGLARLFIHGTTKLWRARFWTHQAISVLCALAIGVVSIWFNDPGPLATVMGLVTLHRARSRRTAD